MYKTGTWLLLIISLLMTTGCFYSRGRLIIDIPLDVVIEFSAKDVAGYVYIESTRRNPHVLLMDTPYPPRGYQPLAYAEIELEDRNTRRIVTTDRNGFFYMSNLRAGHKTLTIYHRSLDRPRTYPIRVY